MELKKGGEISPAPPPSLPRLVYDCNCNCDSKGEGKKDVGFTFCPHGLRPIWICKRESIAMQEDKHKKGPFLSDGYDVTMVVMLSTNFLQRQAVRNRWILWLLQRSVRDV